MPGGLLNLEAVENFMKTNDAGESRMDRELKTKNPTKAVTAIQSLYERINLYQKVWKEYSNDYINIYINRL